jgi:hypothetical protein
VPTISARLAEAPIPSRQDFHSGIRGFGRAWIAVARWVKAT